jgi:hypothetical protein
LVFDNLPEDQLENIHELGSKLGLKRTAEIFNYALAALNWAVNERAKDRIITSMDEEKGDYKELRIPIKNA